MGLRVHEQRYFVVRCEHVTPPLNGGVVNRVSLLPCNPTVLDVGFQINLVAVWQINPRVAKLRPRNVHKELLARLALGKVRTPEKTPNRDLRPAARRLVVLRSSSQP